jgi:hypothetical protein
VEPGLYLTFFSQGEPIDGELPPVGPLEHVVVRSRSLIADRKGGGADLFGGGGRWVEAENELRRATGKEPGGPKRPDLRIAGPEGVYLRFVSFGDPAEHDALPELGPYAVVVVSGRGIEADGDALATRSGTNQVWELTGVGGSAFVGLIRPDVAFRTRSTSYHPEVNTFRSAAKPSPAPSAPAAAPVTARAVEPQRQQLPLEDPALTLRNRIGSEPSTARTGYRVAEADDREWGGAAWRLRYLIIGALVVLLVVFSIPSISALFAPDGPTSNTVAAGTPISSADWTYSVGAVRRIQQIGAAQALGTYMVVRVSATNRGPAGAQLQPRNFMVTAATGERYAAQPTTSAVYSGGANPDSSYTWPTEFPVGRSVIVPLIFEINPSVNGTQLVILDVPATRVRLE